ncbi:MAG: hypothetical protein NUV59_01815 [Patescibacteria group bacterium]|nr:hypothetical protein [Patescibacteria group bacterium]
MVEDPTALQTFLVFLIIWAAMIASGFWEAYVEGRNPWDKGKLGWKIRIGSFVLTGYHFALFWVMYPLLLALPFVFTGWNLQLFGIILSAYMIGLILEDFTWYLVNPVVRFGEWFTEFSDYYPWVKIGGRKIVPAGYVAGVIVALLSWYFFWR